jgi:adenylate kinase
MKKVILVTGVPISGKSETVKKISNLVMNSEVISFGQKIFDQLSSQVKDYSDIRKEPTKKANKDLILEVRENISNLIKQANKNIILDSHAVVVDSYGFRIIPEFLPFQNLPYTLHSIILLKIDYKTFLIRLKEDRKGRKNLTKDEFTMMQNLQASVATSYSILTGCPVYIIDNSINKEFDFQLSKVIDDIGFD